MRFDDVKTMLGIEYQVGKHQKHAQWQDWFKDYMDVMEQAPMIKDVLYDKMRNVCYPSDSSDGRRGTKANGMIRSDSRVLAEHMAPARAAQVAPSSADPPTAAWGD